LTKILLLSTSTVICVQRIFLHSLPARCTVQHILLAVQLTVRSHFFSVQPVLLAAGHPHLLALSTLLLALSPLLLALSPLLLALSLRYSISLCHPHLLALSQLLLALSPSPARSITTPTRSITLTCSLYHNSYSLYHPHLLALSQLLLALLPLLLALSPLMPDIQPLLFANLPILFSVH
jgi:hypothetical protein